MGDGCGDCVPVDLAFVRRRFLSLDFGGMRAWQEVVWLKIEVTTRPALHFRTGKMGPMSLDLVAMGTTIGGGVCGQAEHLLVN